MVAVKWSLFWIELDEDPVVIRVCLDFTKHDRELDVALRPPGVNKFHPDLIYFITILKWPWVAFQRQLRCLGESGWVAWLGGGGGEGSEG